MLVIDAACFNLKEICFVFVFFPIMHIIDIVKMGSAYSHLLLHLPFQSDIEIFLTLSIINISESKH